MLLNISLPKSDHSFETVVEGLFWRKLTRPQAARLLGTNESELARLFSETFKITFRQARTIFPIILASHWLLEPRVSVSDVVGGLQYGDHISFGRCFQEFWPLSPKAFQIKFRGKTAARRIAIRASKRKTLRLGVLQTKVKSQAVRGRRILVTKQADRDGAGRGLWVRWHAEQNPVNLRVS